MSPSVLSSEYAYRGKQLSLRLVKARFKQGVVEREIVEHPGSVVVVPQLGDGRYLLVRQHRLSMGERLIEFPAGTLEPGEDPERCAARELEEETGYRAREIIPLARAFPSPGYSTELISIFLARGLERTSPRPDEDEEIELVEMDSEAVLRAVEAGEIMDLKTIAGLFLALRRR